MKIVSIDSIIKKYEKRIAEIIRKARIFPEILQYCEEPNRILKVFKSLRDYGFREVKVFYADEIAGFHYVSHPYPREVVEVFFIIHSIFEDVWYDPINKVAYIVVHSHNNLRYTVEVPCNWVRISIEPDTEYMGLLAYSRENVEKHLNYLKRYFECYFNSIENREYANEELSRLNNYVRDALSDDIEAYVRWENVSRFNHAFYNGYNILMDGSTLMVVKKLDGVYGNIVKAKRLDIPKTLVKLLEIFVPRVGWCPILVKPRKDLKVDYPCQIRYEDGNIIVIDDEALASTLSEESVKNI